MQKIYKLYAGALAVVLLTGAGVAFQQVRHTRALFHGLGDLQAQVNLQSAQLGAHLHRLHERAESLKGQTAAAAGQLDQLKEQSGRLEASTRAQTHELAVQLDKILATVSDGVAANARTAAAGQPSAALAEQVAAVGRQTTTLEGEVASGNRQTALLTEQVAAAGQQSAALVEQVAAIGRQTASFEGRIGAIGRQITSLEGQVGAVGQGSTAIQAGITALSSQNASQSTLQDLSNRVRVMERALLRMQEDVVAARFRAGMKVSQPEKVTLGDLDTYNSLDHNWKSFSSTEGKQPVSCAVKGDRDRTAVIVTLGQSNIANHGRGLYQAKHAVENFNLYDGKCYRAADPLLGPSGDGANPATRLGDRLIEDGAFDRVIVAPIGMGGTVVEQWADGGVFNRRITALVSRLNEAGLQPDFILWHQGEGNVVGDDPWGRRYSKNLLEVVRSFRRYDVNAPFFVAKATVCGPATAPNATNVRAGQTEAANPDVGVFPGPDTDTIGLEQRYDACHLSEGGLDRHAELWARVLERHLLQRLVVPARREQAPPQVQTTVQAPKPVPPRKEARRNAERATATR